MKFPKILSLEDAVKQGFYKLNNKNLNLYSIQNEGRTYVYKLDCSKKELYHIGDYPTFAKAEDR